MSAPVSIPTVHKVPSSLHSHQRLALVFDGCRYNRQRFWCSFPWSLVTLSIFSCAFWPLGYLFQKNICSNPLDCSYFCGVVGVLNILWTVTPYQIHDLQVLSPIPRFAFLICWLYFCYAEAFCLMFVYFHCGCLCVGVNPNTSSARAAPRSLNFCFLHGFRSYIQVLNPFWVYYTSHSAFVRWSFIKLQVDFPI